MACYKAVIIKQIILNVTNILRNLRSISTENIVIAMYRRDVSAVEGFARRWLYVAVSVLLFGVPESMAQEAAVPDSVSCVFRLEDAVNALPLTNARATVMDPAGNVLIDSMPNYKVEADKFSRNLFGEAVYYNANLIPYSPNYRLLITLKGYEPLEVEVNYAEKQWRWGTFKMTRAAKRLNEVTVTATKVKMVMRGDTLVYDATAFQLPSGSMLDDLIRNLPGATLDRDGRITVNGRMVSSLLVNGRDFFNGDPWVALKNLPYYTVKELKVYRQTPERFMMSKKERSEADRENDPLVMDVNLKPEYIGGWLANVEGGGGMTSSKTPDFRWMGRLFAMHYNKLNTFAVYSQANNINDSQKAGFRGSWTRPQMSPAELTHKRAGFQYNHSWEDQKQNGINASVDAHRSTRVGGVRSVSESFLVGGNQFMKNATLGENQRWNIYTSFDVSRRFGPGRIKFAASYEFEQEKSLSNEESQQSKSESSDLFSNPDSPLWDLNTVFKRFLRTDTREKRHRGNAVVDLHPDIERISWLGDLSVNLRGNINIAGTNNRQCDLLIYSTLTSDSYNRERHDGYDRNNFSVDVSAYLKTRVFKAGLSEWTFSLGYNFNHRYSFSSFERYMRDLDESEEDLPEIMPSARETGAWVFDLDNSYITHTWRDENSLSPSVNYKHRAFFIDLSTRIYFVHDELKDDRLNELRHARRTDEMYSPKLSIGARNRGKGISWDISSNQRLPDIYQRLNITESRDPLHIYHTNPDLKKSTNLNTGISANLRHFGLNLSYNKIYNAIANVRTYNRETGVYSYRRENIDGNRSVSASFNYSQYFGPFSISNRIIYRWNHSVDFSADGDRPREMAVNNQTARDNLEVKFNSRQWYVIGKADIDFNHLESPGGTFAPMNYWDINYGVSLITPRLWDFTVETDITAYCRRGYADATMNSTDWVWNMRITRPFGPSKQWIIKAEALDLLRQFPDIRRSIDSMGRTEVRYSTIPAYALLTLTYRLDIKPKKQ